MYIHTYVCVRTHPPSPHPHTHTDTHTHTHTHTNICTYTHTRTRTYIYIYIYICMYVCICICIYTYAYYRQLLVWIVKCVYCSVQVPFECLQCEPRHESGVGGRRATGVGSRRQKSGASRSAGGGEVRCDLHMSACHSFGAECVSLESAQQVVEFRVDDRCQAPQPESVSDGAVPATVTHTVCLLIIGGARQRHFGARLFRQLVVT